MLEADILKHKCGSLQYRQIVARIRNLKTIEQKSGKEFMRLRERVRYYGNLDYNMVKATIYRENFMYALSFSENMEGYEMLLSRLNRIKNPVNFYEIISKSDVFSDIFEYYKPGEGLIYGNFSSDQERFNLGLEQLGIVDNERENLVRRIERRASRVSTKNEKDYNSLLKQAKSISSAEDLFAVLENYNNFKWR